MSFRTVTVVGVGLIGGSFALASQRLTHPPLLRGIDADTATVSKAVAAGVVDEAATPELAVKKGWLEGGEDHLFVLATPVEHTLEWIDRLSEAGCRGVVTDTSSTKRRIVRHADDAFGRGCSFIGGHPMAGSEQSGVDAARADLFDGAYYVLTPASDADMDAYRALHSYVTALGARAIAVDPEVHDDMVASVSHVPHMAAAALANLVARRSASGEELLRLAAGGFKDMTRIAAGSPRLWTGITMDNRRAVLSGVRELRDVLAELETFLDERDAEGLTRWLDEAAAVRRGLPQQWVPDTAALSELLIPVRDRPGVISEVTRAVGRAGCNIEDIEIDHLSEDSATLRLVLTDEGDVQGLLESLTSSGYQPELRSLEG